MTSKRPKLSSKRTITRDYYHYGVKPIQEKSSLGNYVNFLLGVVLVIGIYLIANAFGI